MECPDFTFLLHFELCEDFGDLSVQKKRDLIPFKQRDLLDTFPKIVTPALPADMQIDSGYI